MECNPQNLGPSSPPTLELGEFLDGILFSPEGTGLLSEDLGTNESPLVSQPTDDSQPSQSLLTSVVNTARKTSQACMEEEPADENTPTTPKRQPTSLLMSNATGNSPEAQPKAEIAQGTPLNVASPATLPGKSLPKWNEKTAKDKTPKASKPPTNLKTSSDGINVKAISNFVSQSEVEPKDVLCLRGNGGGNIPANIMFRQLVSSNKEHFDSLLTTKEKDNFATNLWENLSEANYRFLLPVNSSRYEVLDWSRSVRKCQFALRRCKVSEREQLIGQTTVAAMSTSFDLSQNSRPPKKKQKLGKKPGAGPSKEKNFDDIASVAISKLLSRQELVNATENWHERRKQIFEQQLLQRYQAAALNGLSVEEFSVLLQPVLMKEVGEKDEDRDQMKKTEQAE